MEKVKVGLLSNLSKIKLGSYEKIIIFFDNNSYVWLFFFFLNDGHCFVGVVSKEKVGKLEPNKPAQAISEVKLSGIFNTNICY